MRELHVSATIMTAFCRRKGLDGEVGYELELLRFHGQRFPGNSVKDGIYRNIWMKGDPQTFAPFSCSAAIRIILSSESGAMGGGEGNAFNSSQSQLRRV
jgi:hypothetical protein